LEVVSGLAVLLLEGRILPLLPLSPLLLLLGAVVGVKLGTDSAGALLAVWESNNWSQSSLPKLLLVVSLLVSPLLVSPLVPEEVVLGDCKESSDGICCMSLRVTDGI
jgi:hypothetical protein